MTPRFLTYTVFVLTFECLSSCSAIFMGLYGMKQIKPVDEKTIERYAKKYDIPLADNFELDTTYFNFLFSLDTNQYKKQIKNHYQPLQVLYYDKSEYLTSFHVNCFAGGFPNLKWDRNNTFSTFPPNQQAPLDSILPLKNHMSFLKPLSHTEKVSVENFDYIVVVYWNKFMGRQSKRLVQFVQENRKLETDKKVKIIYVNTDNTFSIEE